MFLLMATYGLRASEVAALPLTDEVGAALVDYLQH